jgi:flagellar hook-length control protein FliK
MKTAFLTTVHASNRGIESGSMLPLREPQESSGEFELDLLLRLHSDTAEERVPLPFGSNSSAQLPADLLSLLAQLPMPCKPDPIPVAAGSKEAVAAGEDRFLSVQAFYAAQAMDAQQATETLLSQLVEESSPVSLPSPDFQEQVESVLPLSPFASQQALEEVLNVTEQDTEAANARSIPAFSEAQAESYGQDFGRETPETASSLPSSETKLAPKQNGSHPNDQTNLGVISSSFTGLATDLVPDISHPSRVPGEPAPVFQQIADHLERLIRLPDEDSMRIQLDPPELGALDITVRVQGNEVQAQVSAEQDWTRRMIEQTMEQLRQMMEERGLHLSQFDVSGGGAFQQWFAQDRLSPQNQQKEPANDTARSRGWEINPLGQWSVWV